MLIGQNKDSDKLLSSRNEFFVDFSVDIADERVYLL